MFMRTCHQFYLSAIGDSPIVEGTPAAGQRMPRSLIT